MRVIRLSSLCALTLGLGLWLPAGPSGGAVMGWWHGTSTCVKAAWNAACNDEIVVYQFTPRSPDTTLATLNAFKIVAGKREPMFDLPMTFAPDSQIWYGDFANARVSIRWSFWLRADTLRGRVVLRPDMRVGREVIATRGPGETH